MDKESETSNTRDFVTTSEAAEALGVSYYTVYEYIKEKRLVADMVGGIYMIPKKAVQEFKAKPTGRIRTRPPLWRKYRAGAKVRGMDIRVRVHAGQQKRLSLLSSGKIPKCRMSLSYNKTSSPYKQN